MSTVISDVTELSNKLEAIYLALQRSASDPISIKTPMKRAKMNGYMGEPQKGEILERIQTAPQDIAYAMRFHRREAELFDLIRKETKKGDSKTAADCMWRLCENINAYTAYVEVHQTALQEKSFLEHLSCIMEAPYALRKEHLERISFNPLGTKEGAMEEIVNIEALIDAFKATDTPTQLFLVQHQSPYTNGYEYVGRQLKEFGFKDD